MESTFLVFLASIIIGASWPKIPKMVIFGVWGGAFFPLLEITIDYRPKTRKNAIVTPFGFEIPKKKLKKCSILWFKITLDYRSNKLEEISWALVVSVTKITIDYRPKNSKNARCDTFCVQNPTKRSKKCSIL